ncbi:glycosyltransferase family 4 protein [Cellulosimicrobium arenosum]|uniref:Glycosyltransferase family 4 protein n=1 Tax=Cellulosimicrobium arenosum TaxID=2708133 RepID=A0A927J0Q8_9MICO|nr:glycosyltransferase family 4 protein [Cellulosimicrobium arenosum]MBD8079764.1 glycosyltransferase family 4 protein [Cellulosimicrobium arenosum]
MSGPEVGSTLGGRRITVVGTNYAPETTGNAPYTRALAVALADAGGDVRVVTGVPHYPQWQVTDPRYTRGSVWAEVIDGVPVTRVRHVVPARPGVAGRGAFEATFFSRALQVVRRQPADLVIAVTPMLSGLAAATFSGARARAVLVQDLTGNGASQSGAAGPQIGRALGRVEYAMLRRCARVGVITERFEDVLVAKGVDPSRIDVLPNFSHVERTATDRLAARRALGWNPGDFIVAHTGNMGMKQGLESVVDAAILAEHVGPPVKFVLVGDGNQRVALEQRGRSASRLDLVPPVTAEQYPAVLAAADVLLVNEKPGVVEMSMPSKLTSYAAARRPVLAAVEPGSITHSFLTEHDAALVVPAGRPGELLDAVLELAAGEKERDDLAHRIGRLYDTVYSREAAERRYVEFAGRALGVFPSRTTDTARPSTRAAA